MAYGTVSADIIQSSVPGVSLGAGNASIMKNRIINGAMVISQRNGTTGTLITSDSQFGLDRWNYRTSLSSKLTSTQSTNAPVGFTYSNQTTVTTSATPSSGDYISLKQIIEGYNIADLGFGTANAKTVTVSFWVYSSVTGTYGARLLNLDATQTYVFQYTVSSANTWTFITVTVPGPTTGTWNTTNGAGLGIQFDLGSGSSFATASPNTWLSSDVNHVSGNVQLVTNSGANWYITGVQLEVGSSATGFEYRQYQQELALCQRYYYQQNGTNGNAPSFAAGGPAYSGTNSAQHYTAFPTTMRATPSVGYFGTINLYSPAYSTPITAIATQNCTTTQGTFNLTVASGLTASTYYIPINSAGGNAGFTFSAEL